MNIVRRALGANTVFLGIILSYDGHLSVHIPYTTLQKGRFYMAPKVMYPSRA